MSERGFVVPQHFSCWEDKPRCSNVTSKCRGTLGNCRLEYRRKWPISSNDLKATLSGRVLCVCVIELKSLKKLRLLKCLHSGKRTKTGYLHWLFVRVPYSQARGIKMNVPLFPFCILISLACHPESSTGMGKLRPVGHTQSVKLLKAAYLTWRNSGNINEVIQ